MCAEATKGIRGKQDLFARLIAHHDLRPVHHRRKDEMQLMPAQGQGVLLRYGDRAIAQIQIIELLDEADRLCVADDLHVWKAQCQLFDVGTVIRLHVIDDQIVQRPSVQSGQHIFDKLLADGSVDRVHQTRLFIQDQISVIGNTTRNGKQIFKQGQTAIAAADPNDGISNISRTVHHRTSFLSYINNNLYYYSDFFSDFQS